MGENNEQLMQFVTWVQKAKAPDISVEDVAQQIQQMAQDPKGQETLQALINEFQESANDTVLFKKGGKLAQLVNKRNAAKSQKDMEHLKRR